MEIQIHNREEKILEKLNFSEFHLNKMSNLLPRLFPLGLYTSVSQRQLPSGNQCHGYKILSL